MTYHSPRQRESKQKWPWWKTALVVFGSLAGFVVFLVMMVFLAFGVYLEYLDGDPEDLSVFLQRNPSCPLVKNSNGDLRRARSEFATQVTFEPDPSGPVEPPESFTLAHYPSGGHQLVAYLSQPPGPGKHPAIIWLLGGFSNGVGATPWEPATNDDDQSASAFREAGLVMMYPTLRGGQGNPGVREILYGEVDDVIAAAEFFRKLPFVDPDRLYLGGHSTGGTLALLVAASRSDLFRAVIAFGPAHNIHDYGPPYSEMPDCEVELRSPKWFISSITTPTFVIAGEHGNSHALKHFSKFSKEAPLHFLEVPGGDHFNILAPVSRVLAKKMMLDRGPKTNIEIDVHELAESL